jgi:glyoxylase-like metal-dependent hydrolase (beta-lactamase superfamily II)
MRLTLNILTVAALTWGATAAFAAAPAKVADYAMQAQKVSARVYAVVTPARDFPSAANKGWNSNSAFVVTRDGVLVFDTGSSETIGRALKQVVSKTTDKPVRWVVNSHGHGDHWLGNNAFAGAEIISSTHVRTHVTQEGASWVGRFTTMTEGATGESKIVAPTRAVETRTTMQFGEVRGELLLSNGGHTAGDVVLWLPEERVLLAGDVVYSDSAPGTFDANIPGWIAFLKELEKLKPKVVVPGHGRVADASVVTRQREFFEQLWAIVQAGHEQGKLDHEILPEVRQKLAKYKKLYVNFDDRIGRTVSDFYQQVEASAFK